MTPPSNTSMLIKYVDKIHGELIVRKKTAQEMFKTVCHFVNKHGGIFPRDIFEVEPNWESNCACSFTVQSGDADEDIHSLDCWFDENGVYDNLVWVGEDSAVFSSSLELAACKTSVRSNPSSTAPISTLPQMKVPLGLSLSYQSSSQLINAAIANKITKQTSKSAQSSATSDPSSTPTINADINMAVSSKQTIKSPSSATPTATAPTGINTSTPATPLAPIFVSKTGKVYGGDGPNGSVFNEDITRQIACVPVTSSMSYFVEQVVIDEVTYNTFKDFANETFVKNVTRSELAKMIDVVSVNNVVTKVSVHKGSGFGSYFKEQMSTVTPAHIVLRANNTKILMLPSARKKQGNSGKRSKHPIIVLCDGTCSGTVKKINQEDNKLTKCSTKYKGGITLSELEKMARGEEEIELQISISGQCCHKYGATLGTLSKNKRKAEVMEVEQKND